MFLSTRVSVLLRYDSTSLCKEGVRECSPTRVRVEDLLSLRVGCLCDGYLNLPNFGFPYLI